MPAEAGLTIAGSYRREGKFSSRCRRRPQTFLGHADARSTRRYARISEHALIVVLRPRVGGLSVDEYAVGKCLKKQDKLVVPTGVEPGAKRRKSLKPKDS